MGKREDEHREMRSGIICRSCGEDVEDCICEVEGLKDALQKTEDEVTVLQGRLRLFARALRIGSEESEKGRRGFLTDGFKLADDIKADWLKRAEESLKGEQ